jgi:hypothetical protein
MKGLTNEQIYNLKTLFLFRISLKKVKYLFYFIFFLLFLSLNYYLIKKEINYFTDLVGLLKSMNKDLN